MDWINLISNLGYIKTLWSIQTPLIFETAPTITLCLILRGLLADMRNTRSKIRNIKSNTSRIANSLVRLGQNFRQLNGEHDVIKHKKH